MKQRLMNHRQSQSSKAKQHKIGKFYDHVAGFFISPQKETRTEGEDHGSMPKLAKTNKNSGRDHNSDLRHSLDFDGGFL